MRLWCCARKTSSRTKSRGDRWLSFSTSASSAPVPSSRENCSRPASVRPVINLSSTTTLLWLSLRHFLLLFLFLSHFLTTHTIDGFFLLSLSRRPTGFHCPFCDGCQSEEENRSARNRVGWWSSRRRSIALFSFSQRFSLFLKKRFSMGFFLLLFLYLFFSLWPKNGGCRRRARAWVARDGTVSPSSRPFADSQLILFFPSYSVAHNPMRPILLDS